MHIMFDVPSHTLFSGASRYSRALGCSSMKSLPPWHCRASYATAGAREQLKYFAAGVATRAGSPCG